MRRLFPVLTALAVTVSACVDTTQPLPEQPALSAGSQAGQGIPDQYIVVFRRDVSRVPEVAAEMARAQTADVLFTYEHSIHGFAAHMSAQSAARLARDARVAYVVPDGVVHLPPDENPVENARPGGSSGKPGSGSSCTSTTQTIPWGIARVGGPLDGTGKTAWIIDTGVDFTHCDLNVDTQRAVSFIKRSNGNDDNGHGTHVAGTIAAINNTYGVVGVAAGARVVPVKVLDRTGSGTWSSVIAGVDYVAANGGSEDVANMSLGGGANSAVDDAVVAAASNGIKFAIAAGNDGADANNYSPARANGPNIYTVSAINSSDVFASWSNWGNPPVDFAAPGVNITSTWKGGGYNTISGTSMATPHVAGLLLLGSVNSTTTALNDPDGNPDPIAHH
jgi:subtilisin family serine protease